MNKLAARPRPIVGAPLIAAVFDLEDPAERFMIEVIRRFHGEDRLYRAHALRRTTNEKGERIVLEVASFHPRLRRAARPEWLVIAWNIDEVSIRFRSYPTKKAATERQQLQVSC